MSAKIETPVMNTRRIQFYELSVFMLSEFNALYDGVGFTNAVDQTQYSFNYAVKMFNNRADKDISDFIIDTVKLRYCKKQKKVICTSHLVKIGGSYAEAVKDAGLEPFYAFKSLASSMRLR